MIVRRTDRRDAAALSALAVRTYSAAFGHSFGAADLAAHLQRHLSESCFERFIDADVVLLAEMEERAVGFVQFGIVHMMVDGASEQDRELRRLYVDPDVQRRGIGRSLMDAAFTHPQLRAAPNVYLDVWEHNHGARRFYERYGFRVIGARRFAVESRTPTDLDLIMVRRSSALSGSR